MAWKGFYSKYDEKLFDSVTNIHPLEYKLHEIKDSVCDTHQLVFKHLLKEWIGKIMKKEVTKSDIPFKHHPELLLVVTFQEETRVAKDG